MIKGKRAVSFIQLRSPNVSSRSPRTCGSRSSSYSIVAPVYLETEHPLCSNPFCKGFWNGFWVSKLFLTGYLEHYRAWLFFFQEMDTWKLRTWESSVKIREMQPLQDGKFLTWWGYAEFGHVPAKFVTAHFDNSYVQNKPIFDLQTRCCLVDEWHHNTIQPVWACLWENLVPWEQYDTCLHLVYQLQFHSASPLVI